MAYSPLQKYQQSSVQTASRGQLIIMLYDGAIRFVKLGIEGIAERNIAKANINLQKAQTILHELVASLDFTYPISKNLLSIYEYMIYRLIQSNIKKELSFAEEVLNHLTELRDTWHVALKQGPKTSES
ncbi:flagellar export chaperone FliS [Paenibacillus turpanensis]|uniref:flagellar export chaperone FliS n=1 Tax=Paenibacillus turpanensis TaxID=2689078 RepID=UPI00140A1CB0|nr:flagellar export chaperone FliS [Paenibacillus turpanensis]